MALPERNCNFCKGTGYRMSRLFDGGLREEVANMIFGNGFDHMNWNESLDMAAQIIDVVEDRLKSA